jgi:AI-2 transport protein TqsA
VKAFMVPLVIAVFIAFAISPAINFLVIRYRIPRFVSIVIVVMGCIITSYLMGKIMIGSVNEIALNKQKYMKAFPEKVEWCRDRIIGFENTINDRFGGVINYIQKNRSDNKTVVNIKNDIDTPVVPERSSDNILSDSGVPSCVAIAKGNEGSVIIQMLGQTLNKAMANKEFLTRQVSALIDVINTTAVALSGQLFTVSLFVFFILAGAKTRRKPFSGLLGEVEPKIRFFLIKKTLLSGATGILVTIIFKCLGVDGAFLFGFMAFILNFVPTFGSIIATALPLPLVFLKPELQAFVVVLAIVLPGIVQVVIGNIIEPRVMGDALDLHPIVLLIALLFWMKVWGIWGALLAAPITAIIKICLERSEQTKLFANIMGGRLDAFQKE